MPVKQVGPHHLSDSIVLCPRSQITQTDICKCSSKGTGLAVHANVVNSMVPPCWEQLTVYHKGLEI